MNSPAFYCPIPREPKGKDTTPADPPPESADTIIDGNGNNDSAETFAVGKFPIGGEKGALSYGSLLDFWGLFDPYAMNTILMPTAAMLDMLRISEFQNSLLGLNFQGTKTLIPSLGATLVRTSAIPANTLIGLDRNYALEMGCAGNVMVI